MRSLPHAEKAGLLALLEPLNRYETHFINRLEQAVEISRIVGNPAVTMMADSLHMNIEEADIASSIREAGKFVAHIHLADSNPVRPDRGHVDFRAGDG